MTEPINNEDHDTNMGSITPPTNAASVAGLPKPVPAVAAPIKAPELVVDRADPGDDTTRRFRYQWTFGAILCLSLIEENSEVLYVYCEHHEDILVVHTDGMYIAIQVKTRQEGGEPFKTLDAQIISSIKRFMALEIKFPGIIKRYVLATNCGFWSQSKTSENLNFVRETILDLIDKSNLLSGKKMLEEFISAMNGVDETVIKSVFSKLVLQQNMPALPDVHSRLVKHLANGFGFNSATYSAVSNVAHKLTDLVSRASSKECEPAYADYAVIMRQPQNELDRAIIAGKRIDADAIRQNIDECRNPNSLLRVAGANDVPQLYRGLNRLEQKMDKGGLSIDNINLAKDLKSAAESHGLELLSIYGPEDGVARWNHVRTLVQNRCQEAHDEVVVDDGKHGTQMPLCVTNSLPFKFCMG